MNAQRIHYAATAALLFFAVLFGFVTGFKALSLGSQAGHLRDLAQEQRARTLRMAALLGRDEPSARAELKVEARRMEEAQTLIEAVDPERLSLRHLPQAVEILDAKPLKNAERSRAFILAAQEAAAGKGDAQALRAEALGVLSEAYARLSVAVTEWDKTEQEKLLKRQYAAFLVVLAALFYQYFVIVRPLSLSQEGAEAELARARAEVEACVGHDPLTGLPSRARLEESLAREVEYVRRYGTTLSAIAMDIDEFRKVNQKLGQLGGDEVLKEFAALLTANLRKADVMHRFTGEKFILLAPHVDGARAMQLAEKLRQLVAGAEFLKGARLTVSLGVAECRQGEDLEAFLARLDEALDLAKAAGMNRAVAAP